MGSSEAEGSSPPAPAMAAVIEGLKKGRQSVATLSTLHVEQLESPTSKLLLEEITNSISKAIAVLESRKSQTYMEAQVDSPSSDVTSRAPGEKRSILSTRKAANRKRGAPYSCSRVTSATIEDGHTWRKYGQKEIFSAKHPRSYFRCTYKYDRGCKATRQVQMSDDCPLYVITYFGEHTCNAAKENNPKVNGIKEEIPFSFFSSQKQEENEEGMELQEPSMVGLDPGWSDSFPGLNSSSASYDLEFMDLDNIFFDPTEFFTW